MDGAYATGRLTARPATPTAPVAPRAGVRPLGLDDERDALLLGPTGESGRPVPLVVSLHGAGGDARGGLALFAQAVAEHDVAVVALPSRGPSWDLLVDGHFGADVARLDRALALVFDSFAIDATRVALAGFSDGASYALTLGLQNGDLFTRVVAFSPGFCANRLAVGAPAIFVSHGLHDAVLPIDHCSRRLVPRLERDGYAVRYEEYRGGHVVPLWLADAAVAWLCATVPSKGTVPASPT